MAGEKEFAKLTYFDSNCIDIRNFTHLKLWVAIVRFFFKRIQILIVKCSTLILSYMIVRWNKRWKIFVFMFLIGFWKMYNGIGLDTVRGSGTNGYVTRNLSFIRRHKDKVDYKSEEELKKLDAQMNKSPNREILNHERKRKVELKCMEMQELMEEQGYVLTFFLECKKWFWFTGLLIIQHAMPVFICLFVL